MRQTYAVFPVPVDPTTTKNTKVLGQRVRTVGFAMPYSLSIPVRDKLVLQGRVVTFRVTPEQGIGPWVAIPEGSPLYANGVVAMHLKAHLPWTRHLRKWQEARDHVCRQCLGVYLPACDDGGQIHPPSVIVHAASALIF